MPGIESGEFVRGAAAREDARGDHERRALDELLATGWSESTVTEALRLHTALGEAVGQAQQRSGPRLGSETALNLVGEARGAALADWWALAHGLDDNTRLLLRQCAAATAAMAMVDGYLLGAAAQ